MKRHVLSSILLVCLLGCGGGPGGGGGSTGGTVSTNLDLNGDYAININTTVDTCGFNMSGVNTVMNVRESGSSTATVDIPVSSQCNPIVYARTDNTLRADFTNAFQFDFGCGGGPCIMEIDGTTRMTFENSGSITGTETNTVRATAGDCSCVILPCSIDLAVAGNSCNGCFNCVAPLQGSEGGGLIPLLLPRAELTDEFE